MTVKNGTLVDVTLSKSRKKRDVKAAIVHMTVKNGTLVDVTELMDAIEQAKRMNPDAFVGYVFIATNYNIQITTLDAEIIEKARELAAELHRTQAAVAKEGHKQQYVPDRELRR
jgi:hypothetical protein